MFKFSIVRMGTTYRVRRCFCSSEQHEVRYYCTFCNEHVGKECLLPHLLFPPKTENGHNILEIRDKITGAVHRRSCEKHPSKTTTAYCDTCRCSICHECMSQEHRDHEIVLISELLRKSICGIKESYSFLSIKAKLWENKSNELQQKIQFFKNNYNKVRQQIERFAKELHEVVDQWKNEKFRQAEKEKNNTFNHIKQQSSFIQDNVNKIRKRMKEKKNLLRNLDALHNPKLLSSENFDDLTSPIDIPPLGTELNLSTSKLDVDMICQYADITLSTPSFVLNESNIVKVDSKHFEDKIILDIACSSNCETAYVSVEGTKKISEINTNGNVVENFLTECSPLYMASCSDGVTYVNPEKKTVFVNTFKTPDKAHNLICKDDKDAWFPRGITSRANNELIVGFKSWKEGRGKVCVVNDLGKDVESFEYDNKNEPLYINPKYITENKLTRDICVTDTMRKTLIAVESSGKYKYSYSKSYADREFNPLNICADSEGRLLLLDVGQLASIIHVLSDEGHFLRFVMSNHFRSVTAMSIDSNDRLWIANRENNKTKIKLINQLK